MTRNPWPYGACPAFLASLLHEKYPYKGFDSDIEVINMVRAVGIVSRDAKAKEQEVINVFW
jgi:hypothetical protein